MGLKNTYRSEKLICNVRRVVMHVEGGQLAHIKEPLQQLPAVQLPNACMQAHPALKQQQVSAGFATLRGALIAYIAMQYRDLNGPMALQTGAGTPSHPAYRLPPQPH